MTPSLKRRPNKNAGNDLVSGRSCAPRRPGIVFAADTPA